MKKLDDRVILHCDLNCFFASVELLSHPELREKPMAVCGDPKSRHGIILAKNEAAKKYGVSTAETIWQAKQKCPDLVLVQSHMQEYQKYSRLVNEVYCTYTDRVEPFGIDESWLDLSQTLPLFGGDRLAIANQIRQRMKKELGLSVSIGVSFNKIFAKLGSDYKKPDATTVISSENFKSLLYPLPASSLLYVGKAAKKSLENIGVYTIGQLADTSLPVLSRLLGKLGEQLHTYALGLDESPVALWGEGEAVKSVGNGMTFSRNLLGVEDIKAAVAILADSVAVRLRQQGLCCTTIQVLIRNPDFRSISRQAPLAQPSHLAKEISVAALEIILKNWNLQSPIRMITITGTGLLEEDYAQQTSLFSEQDDVQREKQEKLEATMDTLRQKYGSAIISTARGTSNLLS